MKQKKCKRCSKKTDMPFHTCARPGPDPIKMAEELASRIRDRWYCLRRPGDYEHGRAGFMESLPEPLKMLYELEWERDFWREKALNP